jgi:hypothetical protein
MQINNELKSKIANEIYSGIFDKNINLNINYNSSKSLELLPLISFIDKIKNTQIYSVSDLENLLKVDEIVTFSKIENLKEKVRLHCMLKGIK